MHRKYIKIFKTLIFLPMFSLHLNKARRKKVVEAGDIGMVYYVTP